MCDNLLDPTHVAWVHESSFATAATKDTPLRVTKTDSGVIVHRWMMDHEPAPFYKKVIGFQGNCDRLQHYEVRYPVPRADQGGVYPCRYRWAGWPVA